MTDFARNKKACTTSSIEETYEAGIQLTGPEVKSVRAGQRQPQGELRAGAGRGGLPPRGPHLALRERQTNIRQLPTRDRKLLLHGKEIDRLIGKSQEDGKTLIPLRLYSKKRQRKARDRRGEPQAPVRQTARDRPERPQSARWSAP